jgi:hypothetical protein
MINDPLSNVLEIFAYSLLIAILSLIVLYLVNDL